MNLNIRAEFTSIFNRTEAAKSPAELTYTATPSKDALGRQTAGFGYMNYTTPFQRPSNRAVGRPVPDSELLLNTTRSNQRGGRFTAIPLYE